MTDHSHSSADTAIDGLIKHLDELDAQRSPGPWRKAHESILDRRDGTRAKAVVVARCDAPWHSGFDHDMAKATKNARFIVALENAWPKLRAALLRDEPQTAPEPTRRQYYYRTDGCPAEHSHSPDCICWHDEGTGPFANDAHKIMTWRTSPLPRPITEKPRPANCLDPMGCLWRHVPTDPEIGLHLCSRFGCPNTTSAACPVSRPQEK